MTTITMLARKLWRGEGLVGENGAHAGMLLLRLAVGAILLNHGIPKLFGGAAATVAFFGRIGIPAPQFFAPFVGLAETLGGISIILGILTSFNGVSLAINMFVAMAVAKGFPGKGLSAWSKAEIDVLLLACMVLFALNGAGKYSLDAWRAARRSKKPVAAPTAPAPAPQP